MKKIWEFFDGKKTIIGGFVVWLSAMPHLSDWVGQSAIDVLYYVGTGLLFGGAAHKVSKRAKKNGK